MTASPTKSIKEQFSDAWDHMTEAKDRYDLSVGTPDEATALKDLQAAIQKMNEYGEQLDEPDTSSEAISDLVWKVNDAIYAACQGKSPDLWFSIAQEEAADLLSRHWEYALQEQPGKPPQATIMMAKR